MPVTYPKDVVLKQDSIRVLKILSEPIWEGDPEKDSVTSYWKTDVIWCDIDTAEFLIGLEDSKEESLTNKATILIEELSPTYIQKGTYKREMLPPDKIVFRRVA